LEFRDNRGRRHSPSADMVPNQTGAILETDRSSGVRPRHSGRTPARNLDLRL
jgi:hypothetical protein